MSWLRFGEHGISGKGRHFGESGQNWVPSFFANISREVQKVMFGG